MDGIAFKAWRLRQLGGSRRGKVHGGFSQSDAARYFNVSLRTVQSWEARNRVPEYIQKAITKCS